MPGPRFFLRKTAVFQVAVCTFAAYFCLSCSNGGTTTPPPPPPPATFELVQVANGFSFPLDIQQPDDATSRLFVVEQGGHIQIIQSNGTRSTPAFLDVSGRAGFTSGGETGLLGLAFHPNYKNNRRFYVNYTRNSGAQLQSVIAEFTASSTQRRLRRPNNRKYSLHSRPAVPQSQRRRPRLRQRRLPLYWLWRRRKRRRSARQRPEHEYAARQNSPD